MDADVIVVGAGPTGLMLAGELAQAGVRPLVVERHPQVRDVAKAGGLSGQILRLLRYRGELDRFEAASTAPRPMAAKFPFGGVHVDFTTLPDCPMEALPLPQPQLEAVLEERARELGAEVRRGHEVVGLRQDDAAVTVDLRGPDGQRSVSAQYLVGCDGSRSRVRELVGIPFPGHTYPEVQRLASFAVPDSVTLLDNGDIEVAGHGRVPFGFTPTDRGVFAVGSSTPGTLGLYTSEDDPTEYDDDQPMTVAEMRDSVRRVMGVDLELTEASRLTRFTFHARQVERYHDGRVMLAGDAAHLFPAPGVPLGVGLLDAVNLGWKLAAAVRGWAPAGLLESYHDERSLAAARTMLHAQAQVALRRGHDAAADALRELFLELMDDEAPLRRIAGLFAGSDVHYPLPGQERHPLVGAFASDLSPRTARPVLVDLGGRTDLRDAATGWHDRVDVVADTTDGVPADALLIRPDGHVAWAATVDEPADIATTTLREALTHWFGPPDPR
jgi:2-polyprenyl-6-methoxyphenol hydroxylase-like FAD-dependent oxidoreductase